MADQFTIEKIKAVAQAYADYLKNSGNADKGIAVAWDTRFQSREFARKFAEIVAGNGIRVLLSHSFTATPVLSFTVKHRALAGGVMITASHNPHTYNGIKFKAPYGGPVTDGMTRSIEADLFATEPECHPTTAEAYITVEDFERDYIQQVKSYLNIDRLAKLSGRVVYDSMYGAGQRLWPKIASHLGLPFVAIHDTVDPQFGGRGPEPVYRNLPELRQEVLSQKAILGIATDGDADRFGIIDEAGQFVELHDLIVLIFEYLVKTRQWSGSVVRSSSMANTIDKSAAQMNRTVAEVPVGFKHICEKMINGDVLIGGEESGGFGYKGHMPERDGILSAFLVLEMMADMKQSLSEMVNDLRDRFGPFYYKRIDEFCALNILQKNMKHLQENPPLEIDGFPVTNTVINDGIKLYFGEDTWMLIRVSQTESLGRVYVGSDQTETVDRLLEKGVQLVSSE